MDVLAAPDEPLMLADGTLLHADGSIKRPQRVRPGVIEVPSNTEAQKIVARTRRTLADLPSSPKASTPIAAVLSFVLFGMDNTDIAIATGLSEQQVATIRMSDAFEQMYDTIVASMIESEADNVRGMFVAASRAAAVKVVELMESEDDKVKLNAANSLLDRAGHRPADVLQIKSVSDNVLRIEVVEKTKSNTIDVTLDLHKEIVNASRS